MYDASGRRIELAGTGLSGGEGTVFRVAGDPTVAAKIYHPQKLDTELHRKLESMAANPPKDPTWESRRHHSIAWVERLLYEDDRRSRLAGFTMPFVDTNVFRQAHTYYDSDDRLHRFGGGYTWRHLLTASYNLASAVAAVHAQGHRVGDLRDTNVLVAPTSLVTLIDCDSFQIRDARSGTVFPTRVGTGDVLPPELQSSDFRAVDVDRYHSDLFALAVLIFKFLMLGVHPFQARGTAVDDAPSTEAKIVRGLYPYERSKGVEPPSYAPEYRILPRAVRDLFHAAFVDGHASPEARPAAREWLGVLGAEGRALKSCRANANHWYARGSRSCPWCAAARATGIDPFPTSVGGQVEAGRPAAQHSDVRREQLRSYVRLALVNGDMSAEAKSYVARLGSGLGLRPPEVDALMDAERRTRGVAVAPAAAEPGRAPLTVGWAVAAPLLGLAALAGALAPVVATAVSVGLVVPVLATIGRSLLDRAAGRATTRLWLMAPARVAANGYRCLVVAAPLAVPFVLAGAGPFVALARLGAADVALRATGAIASAGWLLHALFRNDPDDALLASARLGRDELASRLVSPRGRPSRPGLAVLASCALLAAAVGSGIAVWWPVAPPR